MYPDTGGAILNSLTDMEHRLIPVQNSSTQAMFSSSRSERIRAWFESSSRVMAVLLELPLLIQITCGGVPCSRLRS